MQLSQHRASWEFVQTVTWGKLYLPATPTHPGPHTLLLLLLRLHGTQTYFHFSVFLPADRYTFRQTDVWRYQGFQSAFSATRRSEGGERGGNQFRVLIILGCVRTLQAFVLHSKLLLSFIFFLIPIYSKM